MKPIKILAISGSLRPKSANTAILKSFETLTTNHIEINIYNGIEKLPYFSTPLNTENPPEEVVNFRETLKNADGVIICTPEYAYGMPGVLKNALDWTVSSGEFINKPVIALSATPKEDGGEKAHSSLILTLEALNSKILINHSHAIPYVLNKIDANGILIDIGTNNTSLNFKLPFSRILKPFEFFSD